jgi:hypothetical protein
VVEAQQCHASRAVVNRVQRTRLRGSAGGITL